MKLERKIDLFGVLAILLFGSVIGGAVTYQAMDSRMTALEQKVSQLETGNTVQINTSGRSLPRLFEEVDQSVVAVQTAGGSRAQGSGFVYSEKGYIVTNHHVVKGADKVEVTFTDGTSEIAEVVGTDVYTDLAVLKVEKDNLTALELGNLSQVDVGQQAVAIGNPFGLSGSMTSGIVSQKGRLLPVEGGFSIPNVIQTDAAINPGNSGGPLINMRGEVIGVNTAIETRTGTFSGVGFAIPSSAVKRVVPEIIEKGGYEHPWLGVAGLSVNRELADIMNLKNTSGFLVTKVVEDGPAAEAGIQASQYNATIMGQRVPVGGDVIVAINGEKVSDIRQILTYLARETEVGEEVTVTVIRDGERKKIELTLQERPKD